MFGYPFKPNRSLIMKKVIQAAVAGLLLSLPLAILRAADPLEVAPGMYSLVFQNERVRVMQVVFKPGEKIATHSHPDHFVYVLEAGKLKISHPNGIVTDADLKVGQVLWIRAETHWAEKKGTKEVNLLVTELKEKPPEKLPTKKRRKHMPLYMDTHKHIKGLTAEAA